MSANTPKEVVIIGGSLGGLFAGIVFARLGHNVTILERTPSDTLVDQGAGIAVAPILPPIVGVLKEGGLPLAPIIDFFNKYDRTGTPYNNLKGQGLRYLKRDDSVKKDIVLPFLVASCSWDLLYNMLRADFDGGYETGYVEAAKTEATDRKVVYLSGIRVTDLVDLGAENVKVEFLDVHGVKGDLEADIVIGADGMNSSVRQLLQPKIERKYTGYVAWRGTVQANLLSKETRETFGDYGTFFYCKENQILEYEIPGVKGTSDREETLVNVVWYQNTNKEKLAEILTDAVGVQNKFSLGVGKIRFEVKDAQRAAAAAILSRPFTEVFRKVKQPFIQAVTDNLATKAIFMNGKVLLIGDALAGFRPHTTAGATQAALHALMLAQGFGDKTMSIEEWEKKALTWGKIVYEVGINVGNLSQFGDHPMADNGE